MTYAVRLPYYPTVYFLADLPDNREGLDIEEGAWIDIMPNLHAWPSGIRAPEQVLCRSREDPKHYKLWKYRKEINKNEWEEVGEFGGTYSKESWTRFVARYRSHISSMANATAGEVRA